MLMSPLLRARSKPRHSYRSGGAATGAAASARAERAMTGLAPLRAVIVTAYANPGWRRQEAARGRSAARPSPAPANHSAPSSAVALQADRPAPATTPDGNVFMACGAD